MVLNASLFCAALRIAVAATVRGDMTLPVLEAAHLRPYAEEGLTCINGLLLRADIHKLEKVSTVTDDLHVEVSRKIKGVRNGRD
jgi:putative restriction endonuclease